MRHSRDSDGEEDRHNVGEEIRSTVSEETIVQSINLVIIEQNISQFFAKKEKKSINSGEAQQNCGISSKLRKTKKY